MYRGLLSSPRSAKRKYDEVSLSTTPKRREVGSSSPIVPTHGQIASCPEEENQKRKFSSSFPSEGGEQTRCELNNSDEDIDSWKDAEEKACVPNKGHVYIWEG